MTIGRGNIFPCFLAKSSNLTVCEDSHHKIYRSECRVIDDYSVYIYTATYGGGLQLIGAVGCEEGFQGSQVLLDQVVCDLRTADVKSWDL